jgi:predicted nucleotidyltransferase
MKTTEEIKQIVSTWAATLPFRVRIHLFGSYLKGKKSPSDIDISLELLDISTQLDRMDISIDHRHEWQNYLSENLGIKVDLQFYDKNMKNMPKYLAEASLLLYDSSEKAD